MTLTPARRAAFDQKLAGVGTPGFDPSRQLERLAVVNQTTLLMNETIEIIGYFKEIYRQKYGEAGAAVSTAVTEAVATVWVRLALDVA